jgi:hypothetical protein
MLFAVADRSRQRGSWKIDPMAMSLLDDGMVRMQEHPATVLHRIAQLSGTHAGVRV